MFICVCSQFCRCIINNLVDLILSAGVCRKAKCCRSRNRVTGSKLWYFILYSIFLCVSCVSFQLCVQASVIFRHLSSLDPGALPYASLREWTGDFLAAPAGDGPHGKLGKGAFGEVFKGLAVPPEGMGDAANAVRLAVKRMDIRKLQLQDETTEGDAPNDFIRSFRREINVLSCFRHPNIVRLIGFSEPCPERREPPCLVYELLALGSLANQLKDDAQATLFPWQTRIDILLQISTAINYLHCHKPAYPAYHRDIKADNIALSADYTAKLIDCGYEHQNDSCTPTLTLTLTLTEPSV